MSDASLLEKQLADVQAQLAEAKSENEAIRAKIEEAKDKEFASTVEAFETEAEASKATIEELNESIKSTQARVAELEDALATSQNELAEAMKEVDDMKKKAMMKKRKAALVEAGMFCDPPWLPYRCPFPTFCSLTSNVHNCAFARLACLQILSC